jgi:TRAP-type C4-dicarboxylate transport system substrate-binding protein
MKFGTMMLAAGALALAIPAGASVASADGHMVKGPKVSWKLSLWGKRRAFTEGMEYVSEQLDKKTGGNFKLRLYYGGQLSKAKENLDGISLGAFEAAGFCAAYHPGKNEPLNVLDLPFLPVKDFKAQRNMNEAVYAHPAAKEALAKWNATLYIANILPQYEYMGKGEPPQSVSDFKGKTLRALGGMGQAALLIGATPSTMPASETYTALQRGTVDAIGFPYTYTFVSYRIVEISDWVTTNMKLGSVNCPTVFNTAAYNKLPQQYKDLLESLKDGAYKAIEDAYVVQDAKNIADWKKEGRLKMVEIPEAEMAEFRRIAGTPVWEKWVADNKDKMPAQELLDLALDKAAGN